MRTRTTLNLDRLESRDCPASLYQWDKWVDEPEPIPGWRGDTVVAFGHWNDDVTLDQIAVAGAGGGPVVVVRSGGDGSWEEVWDDRLGQFVMSPRGRNDILFTGVVFPEAAHERIGLDVVMTANGPRSVGTLYATWLTGGGPVVWQYDPATGASREFLAAEPEFRGGLNLTYGTVYLAGIDADREFNSDLIVSAKPGGGPVVRAFDRDGNQIATVMAGDPDSRDGVALSPTLIGVQVDSATDEYGFGVDLSGGGTSLYTWAGRLVSTTRDGDPDTEWRLPS